MKVKRSEMIEYIKDEILEIFLSRQFSNETDDKYYKRKAAGLLDMLEGFGMRPPADPDDIPQTILKHELDEMFSWDWSDEG